MKFNSHKVLKSLALGFLLLACGAFSLKFCEACHFTFINTSKTSPKILVDEKNLEEFNSIDMEIDNIENINLIPSDSYGIEVYAYEKYGKPKWSIKDKKLTIKEKHKINFFFSFSFSRGSSSEPSTYINVYCPKSDFENISVKSVSGDIDANFNTCKNATFSSTSGNIVVKGNTLENTDARSVDGEIKYFGDLKGNSNFSTISGKILAKGNILENVKASSVSGNIKISGDLKGISKLSTTSGNIEINCKDVICRYIYNLDTLSGRITVDDEKFKRHAENFIVKDSNKIDVSTTSGNIDLKFKG